MLYIYNNIYLNTQTKIKPASAKQISGLFIRYIIPFPKTFQQIHHQCQVVKPF